MVGLAGVGPSLRTPAVTETSGQYQAGQEQHQGHPLARPERLARRACDHVRQTPSGTATTSCLHILPSLSRQSPGQVENARNTDAGSTPAASRRAKYQAYSMRLLVVEDDDAIADPLVAGLGAEHFEVERARTAAEAMEAETPDLILLDLGLPDRDGLELVTELRRRSPVPILIITARGAETERVVGLNLGADDYVVKPFGFRELVARIWAIARRGAPISVGPSSLQRIGPLEIDRRARVVRVHGAQVTCTPKEYAIIDLLAQQPGALVTRQDMLDSIWGTNWYGNTKMIDVHMASLRKKIGDAVVIETVRGVGFRLLAGSEQPERD